MSVARVGAGAGVDAGICGAGSDGAVGSEVTAGDSTIVVVGSGFVLLEECALGLGLETVYLVVMRV